MKHDEIRAIASEINTTLLLAIYNDSTFAGGTKYLNYGYINKSELMLGVQVLGSSGYIKSCDHGKQPGETLNVRITRKGIERLRNCGMI